MCLGVKTVKVFSNDLPVELRGSEPEETGQKLDGKNVTEKEEGAKLLQFN